MARTAKPKIDPLLAALIEKLPASGAEWPRAKRAAWLDNMARAFDTVYEGGSVALPPAVVAAQSDPQIFDLNKAYVEAASAPAGHITLIDGPVGGNMRNATRTVQSLGDDGKMHAATVPAPQPRPAHDFYIDHDGIARRHDGARIMPGHVTSALFDMRGESGDPGAIVWADDSRGVRGLRLDISAA